MRKALVIITFTLFLIAITGVALAEEESLGLNNQSDAVACTMDAKLCDDGSYVGRVAPDCEFAPCPGDEDEEELEIETEDDEDEQIVGSSCGTVTPGYNNECCINKGYEGWDAEEFKCIGERVKEKEGYVVGSQMMMGERQPYARERIRAMYGNQSECPGDCECSGSTVKCEFEGGRMMTVYAGNSGNTIVQVKGVNASTNVTLYKENGKVYANFSGNRTKEIHMPDEIRDMLQNRTRTRLYNESVNLTEEGYYHFEAHKRARLFWLIPVREHMHAEVDAETGETVKIRNPWWGFLARDVRDKNNSGEEQ